MENLNRTINLYGTETLVKLDNTNIQWYKDYAYKYTFNYALYFNGQYIITTVYDSEVFTDNATYDIGAEPSQSEYEEILTKHLALSDKELSNLLKVSINAGFNKQITEEQFNNIEYKVGDKLSKYVQ